MSQTLVVPFDEELLVAAGMTPGEFVSRAKFTVAANLWMDGRITAGQAAKYCGMGKASFLHELPKHGFPMSNLRPEDLEDEIHFAKKTRQEGEHE